MRLIHTLRDQKKGLLLSTFLTAEGIENQLEITSNTDWGSPNYGDVNCNLWIVDEDQVEKAQEWIDKFTADPENPMFKKRVAEISPIIPTITPIEIAEEGKNKASGKAFLPSGVRLSAASQSIGKLSTTIYLIIICSILFIVDMMTSPQVTTVATELPLMPQLASPLKKETLYDYPAAYELIDKLLKLYNIEQLQNLQELPEPGKMILKQFYQTPYWHGAYTLWLNQFMQLTTIPKGTPELFEKIRQGEFWRLITPCLMHHDILHLLFNMLWLIVLGQQMEQRLGARRYILFAVLIGAFSNTCQYLMSGPDFIGYSGIICGMLAFIWMRQKIAAWEGYPLQKTTINFMLFFILAMLAIQLVSLYMEVYHQISISPGIANTAHLSGAAFGALLGRLSFFSWKT